MDELQIITNKIMNCSRNEITKQIMSLCSAITPQFYKNLSVEDRKSERLSVELLTSGIDQEVLALMCRMAVKRYPLQRARNLQTYFDINYLLTFYESAFNYFWCDCVKTSKDSECVESSFNEYTNVLTECWKDADNKITVKYIVPKEQISSICKQGYGRYHSPKYITSYFDGAENLEDINF